MRWLGGRRSDDVLCRGVAWAADKSAYCAAKPGATNRNRQAEAASRWL